MSMILMDYSVVNILLISCLLSSMAGCKTNAPIQDHTIKLKSITVEIPDRAWQYNGCNKIVWYPEESQCYVYKASSGEASGPTDAPKDILYVLPRLRKQLAKRFAEKPIQDMHIRSIRDLRDEKWKDVPAYTVVVHALVDGKVIRIRYSSEVGSGGMSATRFDSPESFLFYQIAIRLYVYQFEG